MGKDKIEKTEGNLVIIFNMGYPLTENSNKDILESKRII